MFLPETGGPVPRTGGYWQRHWLLWWCCRGIALVVGDAFTADRADVCTVPMLAVFLLTSTTSFTMAFAGDYPVEFESWKSVRESLFPSQSPPPSHRQVRTRLAAITL